MPLSLLDWEGNPSLKENKMRLGKTVGLGDGHVKSLVSKIRLVESGCWEWTAGLDDKGYALLGIMHVSHRAHRIAFQLWSGVVSKGTHICHTCDVRRCVNPEHLWIGDQLENMADMLRKRRHNFGERVWWRKLSFDQVMDIRLYRKDVRVGVLAREFGVSHCTVSDIRNGRRWKWSSINNR